jgi:hypothetical protein
MIAQKKKMIQREENIIKNQKNKSTPINEKKDKNKSLSAGSGGVGGMFSALDLDSDEDEEEKVNDDIVRLVVNEVGPESYITPIKDNVEYNKKFPSIREFPQLVEVPDVPRKNHPIYKQSYASLAAIVPVNLDQSFQSQEMMKEEEEEKKHSSMLTLLPEINAKKEKKTVTKKSWADWDSDSDSDSEEEE